MTVAPSDVPRGQAHTGVERGFRSRWRRSRCRRRSRSPNNLGGVVAIGPTTSTVSEPTILHCIAAGVFNMAPPVVTIARCVFASVLRLPTVSIAWFVPLGLACTGGGSRWRCHVEDGGRMHAAAALHDEEPGEGEDGEDARTNRHGFGEAPLGARSLRQYISLHTRNAHLRTVASTQPRTCGPKCACLLFWHGSK
jgi:hypothetical protein